MTGYPTYRRPSKGSRRAVTLGLTSTFFLMLFLMSREAGFIAWGLEPGPSAAQSLAGIDTNEPAVHAPLSPPATEIAALRPAQDFWTDQSGKAKRAPGLSSLGGPAEIAAPQMEALLPAALTHPVTDKLGVSKEDIDFRFHSLKADGCVGTACEPPAPGDDRDDHDGVGSGDHSGDHDGDDNDDADGSSTDGDNDQADGDDNGGGGSGAEGDHDGEQETAEDNHGGSSGDGDLSDGDHSNGDHSDGDHSEGSHDEAGDHSGDDHEGDDHDDDQSGGGSSGGDGHSGSGHS